MQNDLLTNNKIVY